MARSSIKACSCLRKACRKMRSFRLLLCALLISRAVVAFVQPSLQVSQIRAQASASRSAVLLRSTVLLRSSTVQLRQVSQIRAQASASRSAVLLRSSTVQLRALQDEAADSIAAFEEPPVNKTIDIASQLSQYYSLSLPFFKEERNAKILLAGLLALTLANSGVSVAFSYIGRDFWTALSQKNEAEFQIMLQKFLGALVYIKRPKLRRMA
jgi:F0F1-type ATP synthase membrane subunit c/vacuolar-type H+-ATPase subunit K